MEANNEGSNVLVHFNFGIQCYVANEVTAHWRLGQFQMILTRIQVYDINDETIKAVTAILLQCSPRGNNVSHQFVKRYIRARIHDELLGGNEENVENFAQVAPPFVEFMMPAAEVMEALELQEQHHQH